MSGPAPVSSPEALAISSPRRTNTRGSLPPTPSSDQRRLECFHLRRRSLEVKIETSDGVQDRANAAGEYSPRQRHSVHSEIHSPKTHNRYAWMRTLERPHSRGRNTITVGKDVMKSGVKPETPRSPATPKTGASRPAPWQRVRTNHHMQDPGEEFDHAHAHSGHGRRDSQSHGHKGHALERRQIEHLHIQGTLFLGDDLMALPVFQQCKHKLLTDISRHMYTQSYAPGTEIVKEGTLGSSLLLVLRGSVNMYVDGVKAQRMGDHQYFGETILLGVEEHWKATLKAETSCTLGEIRREDFLASLDPYPVEKRFYEVLRAKHKSVDCVWAGTIEQTVDLFKGLSERLVRQIDQSLVRRIYFTGEQILVEGKPGDELYILVRGRASVEIAGRTVRIERRDSHVDLATTDDEIIDSIQDQRPTLAHSRTDLSSASEGKKPSPLGSPICFGELGLLGMQSVRSATVSAQTVCQMRVLYRKIFLRLLEEHGESLSSMAHFFEKRYSDRKANQTAKLHEVQIFREVGCKANFLDFLAGHLEDRMYIQGQKIIDERMPDDRCMYIIGSGSVTVLKDDQEVAKLHAGAVVGEITVLGLASKRSSTVVAAETCYVQVLHQSIVVRGLELFPEERQKVLMLAFRKSGAGDEEDDHHDITGDGRPALTRRDSQMAEGDSSVLNGMRCMSTHRAFMKVLKASPLFANTNSAFVDEISNAATDRIYMPGDLIIEQGMRGDSMFIMVSGQAGVFVSDPETVLEGRDSQMGTRSQVGQGKPTFDKRSFSRVGTLHAGSISGELAMLGVSLIRSATIEAETICSMWEITQDKALTILERFPDAQRHFAELIVKHLERTVPARILSLQLFRGFDRKFRTLLGLYCERKVSFPGQCVAREGTTGDQLFCINLGKAMLEKKGVPIKSFSSGSHFGSTVMLGIHKLYVGSLVVVQTCHILSINRTSYIQALDHYPSVQAAQDLKRSEQQATDELREAIQRISARKLVWKRYQGLVGPEMGKDGMSMANIAGVPTDTDMLQRCMQAWRDVARDIRRVRDKQERERNQYQQTMNQWLTKRRETMAFVKIKREKDQLVIDAVNERWNQWRPASKQENLPAVSCQSPESMQLVSLLKAWPTPRQSKFYNLNVWNVLAESLESKSPTQTLLPLLTGPPNSAESNLSAGGLHFAGAASPAPENTSDRSTPSPVTGGEAMVTSRVRPASLDAMSSDSDGEVSQVLEHSYLAEETSTPGEGQDALRLALGSICPTSPLSPGRLGRPLGSTQKNTSGRLSVSSHSGRQDSELLIPCSSPRGSRQQDRHKRASLQSNSGQGPGRRLQPLHNRGSQAV